MTKENETLKDEGSGIIQNKFKSMMHQPPCAAGIIDGAERALREIHNEYLKLPPLTIEEIHKLCLDFDENKEIITLSVSPLVNWFYNLNYCWVKDKEGFVEALFETLVMAVRSFDPEKGAAISTYVFDKLKYECMQICEASSRIRVRQDFVKMKKLIKVHGNDVAVLSEKSGFKKDKVIGLLNLIAFENENISLNDVCPDLENETFEGVISDPRNDGEEEYVKRNEELFKFGNGKRFKENLQSNDDVCAAFAKILFDAVNKKQSGDQEGYVNKCEMICRYLGVMGYQKEKVNILASEYDLSAGYIRRISREAVNEIITRDCSQIFQCMY